MGSRDGKFTDKPVFRPGQISISNHTNGKSLQNLRRRFRPESANRRTRRMLQRRKGRTTGARSGTFRKPAYGGVSKSRQRTAQYLRYSHSDGSRTCQLDRKKKARARIAREEGRGNASRSARHKGFQAERTGIDLLARAFGRRRQGKRKHSLALMAQLALDLVGSYAANDRRMVRP